MHHYTNVVFDTWDTQVLKTASLHLGVAYPEVHEPMPRKKSERIPDHDARVLFALTRDKTQGTYEHIHQAVHVLDHLARVLERESTLDYWLELHEREMGERPEPIDPRRVPLKLLYPADNVRNDPLLTVRRNPDHLASDPHASRAFLLPAAAEGYPWMNTLDNHEMGHDEVEDWTVEDIVVVQQLYRAHHADQPDCTRCRPWRVLDNNLSTREEEISG